MNTMAALNLLQEYLSDTDEETTESKKCDTFLNHEQKNTKLPLPQAISSWTGTLHHEELIDNPSKHDGRIRSFKHERGNWATLIYIDYIPNEDILTWMKNTLANILKVGNLFEEFHVSLTRTLVLKFHWIDSFVEAIRSTVSIHHHFIMELSNIKVYCNDEKSRTFIGITTETITNCLHGLTHGINKILSDYELPAFYKDASYHISFLWCLGDQRAALESVLPLITTSFNSFLNDYPEHRYVHVDKLKCKIGNKLYNFILT